VRHWGWGQGQGEARSPGDGDGSGAGRRWARRLGPDGADAAPPSGTRRLIEVELRDGVRVGGIKGGGLVEVVGGLAIQGEVGLGWSASRGEGGWMGGQVEVAEDGHDDRRIGEDGQDAHLGATAGAAQGRDLVDAGDEARPAGTGGSTASVRWAATSTMRRAPQEGQAPRPVQEKATRRSVAQPSQRRRAKPWPRMPQRR